MSRTESQKLLSLANDWKAAAESHKKEMRRLRSFAKMGEPSYDFYIAKAAHEEIKAQLYETHSKQLTGLVEGLLNTESSAVHQPTA